MSENDSSCDICKHCKGDWYFCKEDYEEYFIGYCKKGHSIFDGYGNFVENCPDYDEF